MILGTDKFDFFSGAKAAFFVYFALASEDVAEIVMIFLLTLIY